MSQENDVDNIEFIRTIYRANSPTVTRQENRIKELEELLDIERESRKRLERNNFELDEQLEAAANQMDECSVSSGQYNEAIRRRDADIQKLRKELDRLSLNMETSEQNMRKKSHAATMEMNSEIENLQKQRLKNEKDKIILLKELETTLVQLDIATKLKATLEAKLENTDGQCVRAKVTLDDLERQLKDINSQKAMLAEENSTLKVTIKDVTNQNNTLRRSKSTLELQLDESKKVVEEEMRQREILQSQGHQLHSDNEQLRIQLEDNEETHRRLQQHLTKINGEMSIFRSKYEKDLAERTAEFEELKRKSTAKINELADEASREHSKVHSLEKARQQLAMEIADLSSELERVEGELENLQRSVKSLEAINNELDNELQELGKEVTSLRMTNAKVTSENSRLRMNIEEEELKNSSLSKENTALSSQLRDEKELLHSMSKELTEILSIKNQLETDRMNLLSALEESKEMLLDTERKYQSSHGALLQLRSDMEQRLMEKNEELDTLRKNSQRTIEELSTSLTELETKYKTEITKMKKKYESQCKQFQDSLSTLEKENSELLEELQETSRKLQEVENAYEEERQEFQLVHEKLSSSERRRIQLQGDLDDSNRLLEAADKSRKNTQKDIDEIAMKFADCAAQINSLTNDKRKLENEISALREDNEDINMLKMEHEERAAKLSIEINELTDEMKQEQDANRKGEALRKILANDLKETKTRLDQRESSAVKDAARNNQASQDRIRELELELEAERSRGKDIQVMVRKQDRVMKDLQQQAEDERHTAFELQQLLDGTQVKMKNYKKQLDELEVINAENVSKYRRAQKQIEEADNKLERRSGLTSTPFTGNSTSSFYVSSYSRTAGAR